MANFVHQSNINNLFKKKNEQVWQSRNQDKIASPTPTFTALVKPRKKLPFKALVGALVLVLLLVGAVSAMFLSLTNQDVRQQASGCVYWDGTPAVEGAYDNRGGVRQQCVNGYWSKPDDGNLDPSQIITEQNAGKPKLGCVNWAGAEVTHGTYDNRGGIRQQCNNGLWDRPDDGNLDPSGMPKPERDMRSCVNWAGTTVAHGTYDVRGDIRQQCLDGLWDTPDDKIIDPNDTTSLAIVGALGGLSTKQIEYQDARVVYDQYCRNDVDPSDAQRCQSLGNLLTQEEQMMRYAALQSQVESNTDQVSFAIGGLEERTMDFNTARTVYREYCQGAKAQQTSSSVCNSLKTELDTIEAERDAAETARWTAFNDAVTGNTDKVANALGGLEDRSVDVSEATAIYREYCQGAKAQQTSGSACSALNESIKEIVSLRDQSTQAQAEGLNDLVVTNTNGVKYAVGALAAGIMSPELAEDSYQRYCEGTNKSYTSSSACQSLREAISVSNSSEAATQFANHSMLSWTTFNQSVLLNGDVVGFVISGLNEGTLDVAIASANYQELCVGPRSNFTSSSACANLRVAIDEALPAVGEDCVANLCINGKLCSDVGRFTNISCEPTGSVCEPNTCAAGTWCGQDGKYTGIACGVASAGCDNGRVAEGRCNSVGQRCVNGTLYGNTSCANEQPDINSIIADNVDVSCFSVCLDRGGSQQRCNEECRGFNPDLVDSSLGYQSLSQCVTAMEIGELSGRCTQSSGGRFVFEPASDQVAAAEYKYCYWWSTSASRCVENVYLNPAFDDCSDQSSGLGNSCGEVMPVGVQDNPEEMQTDQEIILAGLESVWSYVSELPNQLAYNNAEAEINEYYSQLNQETCQCTGSYEGESVTVNVGSSGTGNDGKCYQCYVNPNGSCGWSTSCGYNTVNTVTNSLEQDFVDLQLSNPSNLFMVSNLSNEDQIIPLQMSLDLLPDSLTSNEQITYLVGDYGTGGGLANQGTNIVYVGSPGDEPYTQNTDVQYGYAISINVHETLHILDEVEVDGFCDPSGCPTYIDRFTEVAAEDGLVFETEFSDMSVAGESDFMLYTEYPTTPTEGFAITGAAYVLSPDQLREERPELYAFYRDEVFDGVEYIEVRNADCISSHIEIKSEESIAARQQANDRCF